MARKGMRRPPPPAVRALGGVVLLFGIWEALVRILGVPAFYLPPPSAVLPQFARATGVFADSLLHTLTETVVGYAIGAAVGVLSGVLFTYARLLERMVFPYFVASQAVPVIAFSAIVVLWFGNGLAAKVAIAFYLTFFPVTVNTVRGLAAADPQQVALLRSFGATGLALLWKLRFPAALPDIFVALRLAVSTSLIGAIVGEWFGDTRGLGILLLHSMYTEDMPRLWAGIVLCAALGTALYLAVGAAERRLAWWRAEL
jgi:NitT/TauT family transport system permease protein